MGSIFVSYNQKGGVGKTWFVQMSARCLAAGGFSVLVADLDPQGSVTGHFSRFEDVDFGETPGAYDVLFNPKKTPIEEAIYEMEDRISILHGDERLNGIQTSLPIVALKSALNSIQEDFDFIILDCSPNWTNIIQAALLAADAVVVPAIVHVDDLEKAVNSVEWAEQTNPSAKIKVLHSRVKNRRAANQVSKADQETMGNFPELKPYTMKSFLPESELVPKYTDRNERINSKAAGKENFFRLTKAAVEEAFGVKLKNQSY